MLAAGPRPLLGGVWEALMWQALTLGLAVGPALGCALPCSPAHCCLRALGHEVAERSFLTSAEP